MGSLVKSISKGVGSVFEAVGLKAKPVKTTIKQDPQEIAAQTLAANLGVDLSGDNTPTIQSGGTVTSSADSLLRRKNGGTGVSSGLGV